MTTTDILLIVGVLTSLLNLGEWVLRPHQKKAFEQRFETLTLSLEYTRPIRWFGRLTDRRYAIAWTVACGLFLAYTFFLRLDPQLIGGALALLFDLWMNIMRAQLRVFATLVSDGYAELTYVFVFVLIGLSVAIAALALTLRGVWLTKYLTGSGQFWPYLRRLVLVYAMSALFMFLTMLGAERFGDQYWYLPLGLPLLLLQLVPIVVSTVGLLMMALVMLFATFELVLKLLRAVAWRIVEYSKGAWAAIILICTVGLGIYKAFLQ
jgi:hypothetical protein